MFRQLPVLPVVVPVAAVIFVTLLGHLHHRNRLSAPRAAVALALCVYAAGVVANTVFPIYLDKPVSNTPWKVYIDPFATYEVGDAVTNIVVFVPLGMLVPLLLARTSWWRVSAVAAASSLTIELAQLVSAHFLHGGHVADIHDLIFNVVGAILGFGLLCSLSRVPRVGVLIERFSWR
ncbi:MAG: VanZ family protein [Nocardioidaceae bacterium]|nr:VanZ family protein [Nocardioidaceae bacterium]